MTIEMTKDTLDNIKIPLLILNFFKEDIKDGKINNDLLKKWDDKYDNLIQISIDRKEINGKSGDNLFIPNKEQSLLLLGSGDEKDFTVEELKTFSARGIKTAKKKGFTQIAFNIRGLNNIENRMSSFVEGLYVGDYAFDMFKKKEEDQPDTKIESVQIINDGDLENNQKNLEKGIIVGESINFARDLINRPGNYCTPTILANETQRFAESSSLKLSILEKKDVEKLNMGSFLSVAEGSVEPLKFIVMHHKPAENKSKEKIALVGKGITFDTGGISLKPASNMHEMKGDMSGSAAVIGAMIAISKLELGVEVLGIVPSCENMPSGKATKPGDIVKAMNGTTIEVLNTDAEGRLVLADALCYAIQEKATKIIDVATLTGACVVALGEITTGIMGNNQELVDQFMKSCQTTGERIWQLPLFKKYHDQIKSDVADVANIGGKWGGTITAACFLEKFVDKTPWIHLDIAGTNWSSKDDSYFIKGGTGVMVSSFVEYVSGLAS